MQDAFWKQIHLVIRWVTVVNRVNKECRQSLQQTVPLIVCKLLWGIILVCWKFLSSNFYYRGTTTVTLFYWWSRENILKSCWFLVWATCQLLFPLFFKNENKMFKGKSKTIHHLIVSWLLCLHHVVITKINKKKLLFVALPNPQIPLCHCYINRWSSYFLFENEKCLFKELDFSPCVYCRHFNHLNKTSLLQIPNTIE